jgi:hypothetical protein
MVTRTQSPADLPSEAGPCAHHVSEVGTKGACALVVLHDAAVVQDLTTALAARERGAPAPLRPQVRSEVLSCPWAGDFTLVSPVAALVPHPLRRFLQCLSGFLFSPSTREAPR